MIKSRFAALILAILASLSIEAQQQPQFSQKIEVKLVEIDVSVTGHDGKPVHGLTAADFEILEGRTPQQITNFTEYSSPAIERTAAASAPATTSSAPPPSVPEPHQLLVLIDTLPREQFVRSRVFSDLDALLLKTMHKGDTAGVVFWSPGSERATTIIAPTTDLEAVRSALAKLAVTYTTDGGEQALADNNAAESQFLAEAAAFAATRGGSPRGSSGGAAPARSASGGEQESSDNFNGESSLMRLRRKTAAIQRLVSSLSGPGKKILLYVSNSFSLPRESVARGAGIELLSDLAKSANAVGVTFYAVHPTPFDPDSATPDHQESSGISASVVGDRDATFSALLSLTKPTGGLVEMGTRSVDTLGSRLTEDLQSYYSIAYQAKSDGRDRERRIVVRTKNHDYQVRSRQAYVEKSNETRARDDVLARLFSDEGADDVHFEIGEGAPERTAGNRWLLPLVLKIPTKQLQFAGEGKDQVAHVRVLIAAANGVSEVTKVNENALRIVATAHDPDFVTYSVKILFENRGSKVSIGVFDARSGLLGVKSIDTRGRFH